MGPQLIAIMGPTASGKTELAECLANAVGAQLINGDAFQVYTGLDIGTAKPTDRKRYKLLDLRNPNETFSVGEFVKLAVSELESLYSAGQSAVVVGGSGLYIRALFEEYAELKGPATAEVRAELSGLGTSQLAERLTQLDPKAADVLDLRNPARIRRALERLLTPSESAQIRLPPFRKFKFGLERRIPEGDSRIESRIQSMLDAGWLLEVSKLRDMGYRQTDPGVRAIGYRHIWELLEGKIDRQGAISACVHDTRRYAKRQRTWLRTEPSLIRLEPNVAIDEVLNCINLG